MNGRDLTDALIGDLHMERESVQKVLTSLQLRDQVLLREGEISNA